jgi:hypothetical protein
VNAIRVAHASARAGERVLAIANFSLVYRSSPNQSSRHSSASPIRQGFGGQVARNDKRQMMGLASREKDDCMRDDYRARFIRLDALELSYD